MPWQLFDWLNMGANGWSVCGPSCLCWRRSLLEYTIIRWLQASLTLCNHTS